MKSKLRGNKPNKMSWEKQDTKEGFTELSKSGFYTRVAWTKIRNYVLANEPLCRMCLSERGKVRFAQMVDHIIPVTINSSYELLYGINNLQPLCNTCHRIKTNKDRGKGSAFNLERGRRIMEDLEK